jgi:hypothetical protein
MRGLKSIVFKKGLQKKFLGKKQRKVVRKQHGHSP